MTDQKDGSRTSYDWRCEACGCSGSSDVRGDEDVWTGAQILLTLHRSVSPDCKGGPDAIRVTPRESNLTQRRTRRKATR